MGLANLLKDGLKGAAKILKEPFAAFTVGNLSSNYFKLGVYKPNAGVPAQAPQPIQVVNSPSPSFPIWMIYIFGGVLLLAVLKR